MYCGDETGSFVGEVGSHTSRFGYGGEDCPKNVIPSWVAATETGTETAAASGPAVVVVNRHRRPASSFLKPLSSPWHLRRSTANANANDEPYRTPLRRAVEPPPSSSSLANGSSGSGSTAGPCQPIVDPDSFLPQGDCVEDWDAYEALWESALDTLQVWDARKHTGGRNYNHRTTATTVAASGLPSTSLVGAAKPLSSDNACAHPILAIVPGRTHRVSSLPESSSESTSDSGAGRTAHNNNVSTAADPSHHASSHATTTTAGDDALERRELSRLSELVLETFQAPALFVAPAPMLAAFSYGRQTALVVDVGASGCRATPVVDGLLLRQAQRRSGRGGDWLGNVMWKALLLNDSGGDERKLPLRPRYQCRPRGAVQEAPQHTSSESPPSFGPAPFHRWAMLDLMYELRTASHVQLAPWCSDPSVPFLHDNKTGGGGGGDSNHRSSHSGATSYVLPDGTVLDLTTRTGRDLCRIPELLFTEELPFLSGECGTPVVHQHPTLSNASLPGLVHSALSAVGDVDARRELAASVVLVGGSSLFPNLEQRLSYELPRWTSSAFKTKVLASRHSAERSCASWIGGSILTSLGSFQQLWLTQEEYREYGPALAIQRFP